MTKFSFLKKYDNGIALLTIYIGALCIGLWWLDKEHRDVSNGFGEDEVDIMGLNTKMRWLQLGPLQLGTTEVTDGVRPEQPDF